MAIKNIVFDMGGVLVEFSPINMIKRNKLEQHQEAILKNVFHSEEWKAMDNGSKTVDEAIDKMLEGLPCHLHEKVREIIIEREREMPAFDDMSEIIKALDKNGYRLFILSNCPSWFHDFKKNIPTIELFEGYIVSADHHASKPDLKIFEILLEKFSLNAKECFFIDDSPLNTRAAKELGMSAHCFADHDLIQLKKDLNDCGVII